MSVGNKLTRFMGNVKLTTIKYSPEILLGAGIITGVATIIFACKGTLHADEVLEQHTEEIDKIHKAIEVAKPGEYTDIDVKRDTLLAYCHTVTRFAKIYAPAIIAGSVSVACILGSHGVMRKRNAALAATAAAIRAGFDQYRSRVVRDLGKDMDRHFMYDTVEEVVEHKETDPETGKTKKVKEKIEKSTVGSIYSRFFDEGSKNWEKDGSANYLFIRSQLIYLQNKLIRDGHLFLNDVYKAFGLPTTKAGQIAGWIYDFDNKENTMIFLDGLDMDEINNSSEFRDLMNGYNRNVILNFLNIRDNILDDLTRIDPEFAEV